MITILIACNALFLVSTITLVYLGYAKKEKQAFNFLLPEKQEKYIDDFRLVDGEIVPITLKNGKTFYIPPVSIEDSASYNKDFAIIVKLLDNDAANAIMRKKIDTKESVIAVRNKKLVKLLMRFLKKWSLDKMNPQNVTVKDLKKYLTPYSFLMTLERHKYVNYESVKKKAARIRTKINKATRQTSATSIKPQPKSTVQAGKSSNYGQLVG